MATTKKSDFQRFKEKVLRDREVRAGYDLEKRLEQHLTKKNIDENKKPRC